MPDGTELDLADLAAKACDLYRREFPDEADRYGEAGLAWCRHDNQHIFNWAVLSLRGYVDFEKELTWLAGVLEARDFPLERLARNLEITAAVAAKHVAGDGAGALEKKLVAGAELIRSKPTFLAAT